MQLVGFGSSGALSAWSSVDYEFVSGALVTLEGDPDRKVWNRVEIIGRGLQGRWDPRPPSLRIS